MKKKTVIDEMRSLVKDRVPSAGTNQVELILQSQLMRVLQDLESLRQREKDQLKNAFNKGLIYGMSFNPAEGQQVSDGFDQFYKTEYLDD
jgi:hypothetical protein